MMVDRRRFLETSGVTMAAASLGSVGALAACSATPSLDAPPVGPPGIGICDWNLGPMCDHRQKWRRRTAAKQTRVLRKHLDRPTCLP